MTIQLAMAFLLVLEIQGIFLPEELNFTSLEISDERNPNVASSSRAVAFDGDNDEIRLKSLPHNTLTTNGNNDDTGGRHKRNAWTGDVYEMAALYDGPNKVLLTWSGNGDMYDLLIYSGYPVAGGPGLPLLKSVTGIGGKRKDENSYYMRNLQPNSDYLVHIRARTQSGLEGEWMSFPKITTKS